MQTLWMGVRPNRRLAKAFLLKEQLAQLWTYTDEARHAVFSSSAMRPSLRSRRRSCAKGGRKT